MKIKACIIQVLILQVLLFAGNNLLYAVPARPGVITVTQSDGTLLKLRIYGDEYYHYAVSDEGYTLIGGSNGDYYYAILSSSGELVSTGVKARPMNTLNAAERKQLGKGFSKGLQPLHVSPHKQQMRQYNNNGNSRSPKNSTGGFNAPPRLSDNGFSTIGNQKGLVLLAEFPDHPFTLGNKAAFEDLLNGRNYFINGATGSAWQYYYDNSNGQFDPEFVVAGPYTLPHQRSYYTANDDELAPQMVIDICKLADQDGLDFAQFAEDGYIRDVFVFYSGGGEADGSDPDGIWPHRYTVLSQGSFSFDGVRLAGYACAGELSKYEDGNTKFTSIGTFCHEFGHVLGWPDLYDTDYSTGGQAIGPGFYSLMASGCYNNDSRTPPVLSILERWMVDWAEPEELSSVGQYELYPVYQDKGYLIGTDTADDYFLLEYRGTGDIVWDNPDDYSYYENQGTPGLLVYHIDNTSPTKWSILNTVNAVASHECMKVVCSRPGDISVYYSYSSFFPGGYGVTSLSSAKNKHFRSWNGGNTKVSITDITLTDGVIRLTTDDIYYGMSDYSVQSYQYDALLSWDDNVGERWTIVWKPAGSDDTIGSKTITKTECHLSGLKPGKQYEVTISNSDGMNHTFSFTTQRKNPSYFSHIELSPASYSSESPVLFHLADCGEIETVKWYVDGAESENYTTFKTGEYCIQAEITREDGNKEYLMQYITIQ